MMCLQREKHWLSLCWYTRLHCEEICCICWSMRAILCSISSNWLSLSFISSKLTSFSSIVAKEAFSCAMSLSLAWLECISISVRALLQLQPFGLGPNPIPRIRPLRSLPITLANTSFVDHAILPLVSDDYNWFESSTNNSFILSWYLGLDKTKKKLEII